MEFWVSELKMKIFTQHTVAAWSKSVRGVKRMFSFVRVGGQVWSEHYEENVFLYMRLCYLDVSHSCPCWKLFIIPKPQEVCCRSKLLPSFFLTRYPQSGHAVNKKEEKMCIFHESSLQHDSKNGLIFFLPDFCHPLECAEE